MRSGREPAAVAAAAAAAYRPATAASAEDVARAFFDAYAQALLARDGERLARLYAVPALIAFPERAVPVTDREQTRQFFEQGWGQYEGVDEVEHTVAVVASTAHSICVHQLLRHGEGWQVGVLTPLGPDD